MSEAEIRRAIRILFTDTHNLAEGAGAAPLAAALQERRRLAGKRVAVVQSGGNIDRALLAEVLAEAKSKLIQPAYKLLTIEEAPQFWL